MRSLILAATVALSVGDVLAQGRFIFGNRCPTCTPPVDARVYDCDSMTFFTGTAYSAQAYIKPVGDPDSSYRPVGEPVPFKTGNDAGYIESVEVITPFPADTLIVLQMRAWEWAGGDSYEAAIYAGKMAVKSNPLTLRVTVPPDPAPHMVGLQGFCFIPPPPARPSITGQPSGVRVTVDHPWALQVSATGGAPLDYQWYRDGQALTGENAEILSVAQARLADSGEYCVVVTNAGGHMKSQVARVVVGYPLTVTTNGPGRIEVRPSLEVFEPGQTVELTAVPEGGARFEGWAGDVLGLANPATLRMDEPKAVQAWFSLAPLRLDISWHAGQARIDWTPPAVLQASGALALGDWQDVSEAASPYEVEPANAQRFYRLRRPRRRRRGKPGSGPREAFWSAAVPCRFLRWGEAADEPGLAPSSVAPPASGKCRGELQAPEAWRTDTVSKLVHRGAARRPPRREATSSTGRGSRAGWLLAVFLAACQSLAAAQPGEKLWEFQTGSNVVSTPAIGTDGTVYVGSLDRRLYALNGETGVKRWEYATGGSIWSSPAIGGDGTVFVGSGDRKVHALDGATGQRRWEFVTGAEVKSSAAIGREGTVYIASLDNTVYALDAATGTKRWHFGTSGGSLDTSPALGADGTLYVAVETGFGCGDGRLYALDGLTGRKQWESACGGASPAIGTDGTVYVAGHRFFQQGGLLEYYICVVRAMDGLTGREVWTWESQGSLGPIPVSPVVGPEGTVYVVTTHQGTLSALDRTTGRAVWEDQGGWDGWSLSSPAIGADGVVIGSKPPGLVAVRADTGQQRWVCDLGGRASSPPAIGVNGVVYVGSWYGKVCAVQGSGPLAQSAWPKFRGDGQNTGRVGVPPAPPRPPEILEQPSGVSVPAGSGFSLRVVAIGNPCPTFQWYRDEAPVPGATESALGVDPAEVADAGDYRVQVSNAVGSVTSQVARVNVGYRLTVTTRPGGSVETRPSLDLYPPGQVVQLTAWEGPRRFLGWEGDASGTANPLTLVMDRHLQIVAVFTPDPADLWPFVRAGLATCPALGKDGAFYVAGGRTLYALDLQAGITRWEFQAAAAIQDSPAIGLNGTVYVGSDAGRVYALDGRSGALRWVFVAGGALPCTLAIGVNGTVYVTADKIYAIDSGTGEPRWVFPATSSAPPTVGADETVYVSADKVYALDAATGDPRWEVVIGGPANSWSAIGAAIGADETVYVCRRLDGGQDGLLALDRTLGRERWRFVRGPAMWISSPVLDGEGTVYVASDGKLYALSGATGETRWEAAVGQDCQPPAIGADGKVYVASTISEESGPPWEPGPFPPPPINTAVVEALDPATGRTLETFVNWVGASVGSPPAIGPDGALYVGIGSSQGGAALHRFAGSAGGLADSPWPKFHGDAQNTGRVSIPDPLRVDILWRAGRARLEWTKPAVLQSSDALAPANWQDLSGATSPYEVEPANAQRFYRLRRPRRARRRRSGGETREASSSAADLPPPRRAGWLLAASLAACPSLASAQPGAKLWEFETGGPVSASPALGSDGTLYVAVTNRGVYAFEGDTGVLSWFYRTETTGTASGTYTLQSPAVGPNGVVYVGWDSWADQGWGTTVRSGRMCALHEALRTVLWSISVQGGAEPTWDQLSCPALAADGTVYVARHDYLFQEAMVWALDGATGTQRWECKGGFFGDAWLAVGGDGTVFVGFGGKLRALDGATGVKRWELIEEDKQCPVPVAIGAGDVLYVWYVWFRLTDSGWRADSRRSALDGATGTKRWEYGGTGEPGSSPAIAPDGTIYFGSSDGRVLALDGATGSERWTFTASGKISSTPAVGADGTVYVGSFDNRVYALNGATGVKVWEFATGGPIESSPALGAHPTLYIGSNDGQVYALATSTGLAQSPWPKYRGDAQNSGRVTPPAPLRLAVSRQQGKARLEWTPPAVLQSNDGLVPGDWQDVRDAASPYDVEPANVRRFYRLRRPRRARCETTGRGALKAPEAWRTPKREAAPDTGRGSRAGWLLAVSLAACHSLAAAQPGAKLWEFTTRRSVESTPALGADATVYFGSTDNHVYALDGLTGRKKWEFATGGPVYSSAAVGADGTVYIGSYDTQVYALAGSSGRVVWKFQTASPVYSTPAIGADGTVYVGSLDSHCYALDRATGQERWAFAARGDLRTAPAVGADGTVYVGSNDDRLYAVSEATGQVRWSAYPSGYGSAALGADDTVYAGTRDGWVVAFDGLTGATRWAFATTGRVETPAIGTDGTVYVGVYQASAPSRVYALDGTTGRERWVFLTGGGWAAPAIGADGTVYVVTFEGPIYALDGVTGGKRWEFAAQATSAPAIGEDGTVYVGSRSGKLYALASSSVGGLARSSWPKFQGNAQNTGRSGAAPPTGAPIIAIEPEDRTSFVTADESFLAWGRGALPLTYRWYKDGVALSGDSRITGIESERLSIAHVGLPDAGHYQVAVTNAFGSVTSRVAVLTVSPQVAGQKLWEFQTGSNVVSTPAIGADGTVYVGSLDRNVYALNGETGVKRWEYATGGSIWSSPAIGGDGTVYVGSGDRKVHALDGATGQRRWEFVTGAEVKASAAIGRDGTVYIASLDNKVCALDGATGGKRWGVRDGLLVAGHLPGPRR